MSWRLAVILMNRSQSIIVNQHPRAENCSIVVVICESERSVQLRSKISGDISSDIKKYFYKKLHNTVLGKNGLYILRNNHALGERHIATT